MRRGRLVAGVSACAVVLALGGCSVGPDYVPVEAASLAPEAWSGTAVGGGVGVGVGDGGSVDIARWWEHLGDEELVGLIDRAMASSLTLAEARERVVAARARRGIANADRLPALDAAGSYTRTETGDESFALLGPPGGEGFDVYSLGVVAGWEVDLWGRVGRLVEAADAEIDFAVEDLRASRVSLAAEIAREVVLARSIDAQVAVVESTIATDRDAVAIAEARARAGFGDDLDVARARRELEANRALLPGLRADRREAELRIAVLMGVAPGSVEVGVAGLPRRDVVPGLGVPAELLLRRPDLRRAERAVAAATARIGAAEAERYPRVSLSGSIALQGPDAGDVVNPEAFVLSAGPSISVPIFEGGRIESRVNQAESDQRRALLGLRGAVIGALAEVETASMRRIRAEERVTRLVEAEASARDAEELSVARYTAGRVDFLDVTEARRARLAIERSVVTAERDALLRLVDLYTALGGGWAGPEDVALLDR